MDWDAFVHLTHHYQVVLPVRVALSLAQNLLRTEVPEHVLAALPVSAWRERTITGWVGRMGIFEPSEKKLSPSGRFLFYFLLADSWSGSLRIGARTFFMPVAQLKLRYGFRSNWLIPYYYAYNAGRIVLRRRL